LYIRTINGLKGRKIPNNPGENVERREDYPVK
jgi:hypothetical protein